jgi:glutamate synthase (NADPH/NADH) large chain
MGTSTLRSYRGAQIVEAIGIDHEVIDKYFEGTTSRIGGIGLKEIAEETLIPFNNAFEKHEANSILPNYGFYRYRKSGEKHSWNPESIGLLQWATKTNNYQKFKEFSTLINSKKESDPVFIRDYFIFKKNPIDISEVEPEEEIMKRFVTGAMSFGSISKEAHEALAIAMNKIGAKSNTGEGGEDPERFTVRPDGSNPRSAIKQVASGRFGVTTQYLVNADEIQIKIAQGAKPGEGGQLPGHKVNEIIAKTRNSTPGITLISPPPHHDIYSIEDLKQLIFDLKNVNPKAEISVKLVSESGVGTVAAGVAKAIADRILISGAEGGTGASPASSIKHAGLPMELGISETQQTLVINNLREKVRLQTDGQLKTGMDVIIAALLGADEFGFGTTALIVLGCVMMRKCHLNTCPVGVATQDPELRKRFLGRSEYLINYFTFLSREIREIMAEMGVKKFEDLVGRSDLLSVNPNIYLGKAKKFDFSKIIHFPQEAKKYTIHQKTTQDHHLDNIMDRELIKLAQPAIQNGDNVVIDKNITNVDRTTGAMLSGEIVLKYGSEVLPEDTITCNFKGSAGQSFGAFLCSGITFNLEGDTNDYIGKGLSGGRIIVKTPPASSYKAHENIIVGNVVLYGATGGELYVNGLAGERFAIRNSGAKAVVEGVGDHGCEYMTGGCVVVLGQTGRNFAAGMSGGIAYVLDTTGRFDYFCNMEMVELSLVETFEDINEVKQMVENHYKYTNSELAKTIVNDWDHYIGKFIKIIPYEFKKILEERKIADIEQKMEKLEHE